MGREAQTQYEHTTNEKGTSAVPHDLTLTQASNILDRHRNWLPLSNRPSHLRISHPA